MTVVIVGNGLAGTLAAKALRDLDARLTIEVFAQEPHLYYPRPNLIEYLAGTLPRNRLFAFPERWYSDNQIDIRLATPVTRLDLAGREVEIGNGDRAAFDALLLANGAAAAVPPIRGASQKGVFTLRTLDDAEALLTHVAAHPRVAVLGGGLLGLEIARALRTRGADVEVVEFFPYLLPRQLDPRGGEILKTEVEKTGIRVRVGVVTEDIRGDEGVRGLTFKDGSRLEAETVVIAAGVRPNIGLAQGAGLKTDRGLLVDDYLETEARGVFAAGDGVQHRGRIYGIIPASFDQSRIAAANILGQRKTYEGTTPSNTLKVAGLHLTSVGLVNPEGGDYEHLRFERPEAGIYKKIVLHDGRAVGAIWLGTKSGINGITRAVLQQTPLEKWKGEIFEDTFDFSLL
jgi:nitrite reductase (NADH) large subunit